MKITRILRDRGGCECIDIFLVTIDSTGYVVSAAHSIFDHKVFLDFEGKSIVSWTWCLQEEKIWRAIEAAHLDKVVICHKIKDEYHWQYCKNAVRMGEVQESEQQQIMDLLAPAVEELQRLSEVVNNFEEYAPTAISLVKKSQLADAKIFCELHGLNFKDLVSRVRSF